MEELKNLKVEAKSLLNKQLQECEITDFYSLDSEKFAKLLQLVENSYTLMDENSYKLKHSLSHSRYEGMAEMIGNIAHQWRQPLSAISSLATGINLKIELGIDKEVNLTDTFNQILGHTKFLNQTIVDFAGFLKIDAKPRVFDLFEILLASLGIVDKNFSDSGIKIYMKDYIFLDKSFGFSNEISQVLLHLLSNSKDALVESKQEIKAIYIDMDEDENNNIIKIIDNAGGIPDHIINKIFDPYFTTKHQSLGTGIGLYASKDIIENSMNGKLLVHNIDKDINGIHYVGACFSIFIPKVSHN
jgi:signal transduction histidine kinase